MLAICAAMQVLCERDAVAAAPTDRPPPATVEFNRDVRPILSEHCFACHGPDKNKREADLRLDTRDELLGSGDAPGAVAAGKPDESELLRRITSTDADERMPPPENGPALAARDVALLKRWIEQGAKWEGHWAFEPIKRGAPPAVDDPSLAYNPIDAFVLAALKEQGLTPSPVADRRVLARRLSFDLTGLPPTVAMVEAFVGDGRPDAYERLVDALLASPHFGERMAVWWLDLVRYADSVGYHGDQPISVSPFRDYVIDAFNANLPFDQFTREQIAGDLLENATLGQRVAAGYNRLGMMSAEGGGQDKEYLAKYASERVRSASGAWMGTTLGCAECHDHKYDPFTTKDFYRFEAFFADIKEMGIYHGAHESGKWGPTMRVPNDAERRQIAAIDRDTAALEKQIDERAATLAPDQDRWEAAQRAFAGAEHLEPCLLVVPPPVPDDIARLLAIDADKRDEAQAKQVADYYRTVAPALAPLRREIGAKRAQTAAIEAAATLMLATETTSPRTIRVLARGNWMDDQGEIVEPAVPAFLPQPKPRDGRLSRRDLADWLVAKDNPLTARATANRLWKLYFGAGLSRKLDDLGGQGEPPSHPLLLDWLSVRFIDSGWDVKGLVKLMVMSRTYQQTSHAPPGLLERDPDNRWLARQSRYRFEAEFVRDAALATSGLLDSRIGGPSVKPYQPPGYWSYLNFPPREWQNDTGGDLYRRGLYTHWQRQYLHPSMLAFDAPSREECVADRPRSNTPLQALALLNDPTYVEAARAFAERIVRDGGPNARERLDWAFRTALGRPIRDVEATVLAQLVEQHLDQYRQDRAAADALQTIGAKPAPSDIDAIELAAWTSAARTILNLHEMVTRN